ncbi:hypothetical protein V5799_012023 [Amblyomma americanum]|uniref:Peptidase S1 domain-containing protein n=1 Tax=Amblyomma americanum TaxID=6943 RepID=A0AAQ4EF64_AMBAM
MQPTFYLSGDGAACRFRRECTCSLRFPCGVQRALSPLAGQEPEGSNAGLHHRTHGASPQVSPVRGPNGSMWLLLATLGAACLAAAQLDGGALPPGGGGAPPLGDCVCVPYYQCKDGKVSEDGGGLLDARRKLPPKEEIPLDGLGDQNQQCPGVDQICCAEPSAVTETPYVASCGIRNDNGINSRILTKDGKGEAEFGEWPWQAAVLKYESEILKFECGGTLIASRYVLTVAHCVARFTGADRVPLKVRLGEWDTQSMKEFYPHEDYDVGNIFIHQYFRNSSLWNDIALLELTRPVNFAPHISPICLPKLEDMYEGTSCVVTGWGKDAYREYLALLPDFEKRSTL